MSHRLKTICRDQEIAFQTSPTADLGNDSKIIQISDGGVATTNIGIPSRNMHTQVEVCDLKDIEASIRLLTHFVKTLEPDIELRPLYANMTA